MDIPAPRSPGRPTLFTPANCKAIVDNLRKGYKRKLACSKARVSYTTFNDWLRYAKDDPDSEYALFAEQVYEAETDGTAVLVDSWLDQTKTDYRAAKAYLAIKEPEEYSEQRQLHIQHSGNVNHDHVHSMIPPPDPAQLAGLLGYEVEGTYRELE